jgi:branched-chain amino acid transport system permease protein
VFGRGVEIPLGILTLTVTDWEEVPAAHAPLSSLSTPAGEKSIAAFVRWKGLEAYSTLAGRAFPAYRVAVILASAVLIGALWIGLERTRWGAMVRATVDNRAMAQSIGIDTGRLFTLTFALGSGLAALGGALGADLMPMTPTYPFEQLVYFLIVVAIGGLGNLRGPFVGALIIGIGDTACKYWVPELGAFFVYVATIGLLLWKPRGLFGRAA